MKQPDGYTYRARLPSIDIEENQDNDKLGEFLLHLSITWDGFECMTDAADFSMQVSEWLMRSHCP